MVLSLNLFESAAAVTFFLNSHGYTIPVLLDAQSGTSMKYGVSSIPMTVFIGRDGIIKVIHRGAYSSLAQMMNDLAKAD